MRRRRTRSELAGAASRLSDDRGSMLLIALLVLLALSGVGLVMVQKVSTEQNYVGNDRRGSVAYHVTESGAYTSLAYADSLGPYGFMAVVQTQATDVDNPVPRFYANDLVADTVDYFDMSESGSFGLEGNIQQQAVASDPSLQAPIRFQVEIVPEGMLQPLMGYSINGAGARCRFKYRFDTDGNLGFQGDGSIDDLQAWKRIRALMYVGPLPCNKVGATS